MLHGYGYVLAYGREEAVEGGSRSYRAGFLLMPNKHNADRRHHFGKMKFKIRNWASYEAGLRRRGSLMLWVTDEAIAKWQAPPRLSPGGQAHYSDMAIETALMLRQTFHLPLRQTEGFMQSIFALLGVTVSAPDHRQHYLNKRNSKVQPTEFEVAPGTDPFEQDHRVTTSPQQTVMQLSNSYDSSFQGEVQRIHCHVKPLFVILH